MEVKNKQDERGGYFFIKENNNRAGAMYYHFAGHNKMVIDHTEVDKKHAGEGMGKKLVKAGVEYARTNSIQIVPVCSFAKKVLEENKEYADVLAVH